MPVETLVADMFSPSRVRVSYWDVFRELHLQILAAIVAVSGIWIAYGLTKYPHPHFPSLLAIAGVLVLVGSLLDEWKNMRRRTFTARVSPIMLSLHQINLPVQLLKFDKIPPEIHTRFFNLKAEHAILTDDLRRGMAKHAYTAKLFPLGIAKLNKSLEGFGEYVYTRDLEDQIHYHNRKVDSLMSELMVFTPKVG